MEADHHAATRTRDVSTRARREALDYDVVAAVDVIDVEPAIRPVLRIEGHPEQTSFEDGADASRDVEKGCRQQHSALDDPNASGPLDDEKPSIVRRRREKDRQGQPLGREL